MAMEYRKLLSPCKIGTLEIKNRFVVPALGTNFGDREGHITQQLKDYYIERAKGGFGLIILEVCAIDPYGKAIPNQINVWNDECIPGLKDLIDEIHRYGAKVAVQLHHAGRQTDPATLDGNPPIAPSAVPCPVRKTLPKELSTEEVYELIEKFGDAALRAQLAGADAVELNGAHGYIIAQFMSQYSNKRLDEFGGNLESRLQFPIKILRNIRGKCGNGFPVIFRFCGDEMIEGGRRIQDSEIIAQMMEEEGAAALSVSMAVYGSLQYMSAPAAVRTGYITDLSKKIKEVVDIPVIVAGRINNPRLAESIIKNEKSDFVALGRVSVADPYFPAKVASGRTDEIAPCVACLQGCIGNLFDPDKQKITCLVNPFVGREKELKIEKTVQKKKIMVAGAGPAGMAFAWVAAKRGHQVVCYEKTDKIGGQFRLAGIPPCKDELLGVMKYLQRMNEKYGVELKRNTEVTPELITREKPDAVILATGATPLVPPIPGIDNPRFVNSYDLLDGKCTVGQKVLVVGGGLVGVETADYIADRGSEVTIIEYKPDLAMDEQTYVRMFLMKRLEAHNVKSVCNAKVQRFTDTGVIYENVSSQNGTISSSVKHLDGFDSVVIAMGHKSYNPLETEIKNSATEVYVLGDAKKAGLAMEAIREAVECAVKI